MSCTNRCTFAYRSRYFAFGRSSVPHFVSHGTMGRLMLRLIKSSTRVVCYSTYMFIFVAVVCHFLLAM